MDYGAVESSSSLIRPGSDVLGTEVPGLQDSSHDHELFEMLAADKAHAGEAPKPRFLRWLPTWCGPLCLSLSIAGVLFLLVLAGLTSSGYEYIRLSGDYEKHSTNLLWAAVIYACTGALSTVAPLVDGGAAMHRLEWGDAEAGGPAVLALHGWMDNAGSFSKLGRALGERHGCHVAALTFPGHGVSARAEPWGEYHQALNASAALEALVGLGWVENGPDGPRKAIPADRPLFLLGHSMGGAVSAMVAAALGTACVDAMALIEGHGLFTKPPSHAGRALQDALRSRVQRMHRRGDAASAVSQSAGGGGGGRAYEALEAAAAQRRQSVVGRNDGQILTPEAALALVAWSVAPADERDASSERVKFTHDPGLRRQSISYQSEDQVLAALRAVEVPALLLTTANGWPWGEERTQGRAEALRARRVHMEGGHHPHLDADTADTVLAEVAAFFEEHKATVAARSARS
ncbi:hypothetical protein FNF28_02739 [Cafeteria roenbergensis]|uniref:AB hydrolase-1 domain-containing protein n=1 Tax=Cafeteria roenbergensis TaxID=33653 RepID=A0A5A8DVB6_CAFRO|nr:hypothetical protein FNF28_02739 [Cafeteria roenbergensis]